MVSIASAEIIILLINVLLALQLKDASPPSPARHRRILFVLSVSMVSISVEGDAKLAFTLRDATKRLPVHQPLLLPVPFAYLATTLPKCPVVPIFARVALLSRNALPLSHV